MSFFWHSPLFSCVREKVLAYDWQSCDALLDRPLLERSKQAFWFFLVTRLLLSSAPLASFSVGQYLYLHIAHNFNLHYPFTKYWNTCPWKKLLKTMLSVEKLQKQQHVYSGRPGANDGEATAFLRPYEGIFAPCLEKYFFQGREKKRFPFWRIWGF